MCGIFGVLGSNPHESSAVVVARDRMTHRGPDGAGVWRSEDGRVSLAHRRLAVIAPTPDAAQPMASIDGRYRVTYNGELYNYRALRAELQAAGRRFETASDTEVLIEACRQWGPNAIQRFSGMFAFGLWDTQTKRLLLARDRAGEKPLYYAFIGRDFVFASELKAIAAWPGFQRRVHQPAVVDFLTLGFVADPKCIWEGCQKLPPGHWMSVELSEGGARISRPPTQYWDLEFDPDHERTSWDEEIRDTLVRAADEMAVSDVPLGAFLSGGVDSSAVTAALARSGHHVRSFTVGFDEEGFDEREFAETVAAQYGTEHYAQVVHAGDVAPVFSELLWHYDEPFGDYSYLPTFYLCRAARARITVALSGDGADELFAGYRKYQRVARRARVDRFVPRFAAPVVDKAATLISAAPLAPRSRVVLQYGTNPTHALTDMLTVGFSARTIRRWSRGALRTTIGGYSAADAVGEHLKRARPEHVGLVNSMRYLDLKLTLAGDILVKVDRASMAVSLEVRPVFLHRDLMSLAGRIPATALATQHTAKLALKHALQAWLPDRVLFRPKQGFALPLANWIRAGTAVDQRGHAAGSRLAEWLDPRLVERIAQEHAGGGDHAGRLHALLLLDRWLDRWEAA